MAQLSFGVLETWKGKLAAALSIFSFLPNAVQAHCPLCSAAVGAGVVVAEMYGFDTSVIGIFVGAFAISTGLWAANWLKKEYVPWQKALVVAVSFALTVVPVLALQQQQAAISSVPVMVNLAGDPGGLLHRVYWVDKLLFGSIAGGAISLFALWANSKLKSRNNGKVYVPFQGIVLTLSLLLLASASIYLWARV